VPISMRRIRFAALTASILSLALAIPVSAKTPPFTVELDPAQPVAGEVVTVTVRFWADAGHSQPAGFTFSQPMDELLAFVPSEGTPRDWIHVTLEPVATDLMRGRVTLPSAGEWTLTPWPGGSGGGPSTSAGYPGPMAVSVAAPSDPAPLLGGLGLAAAIALGGLALLLARLRRRRRGRELEPGAAIG